MTNFRLILPTMFKIIVIVAVIFSFCKDKDVEPVANEMIPQDTSKTNVQELMLENQSKFEENINSIMELIKEKEEELQKAEQELNQKSAQLEQKEEELANIEKQLNQFRTITYVILILGIILIIVGLILIFIKRKSRSDQFDSDKSKSSSGKN